MERGEKLLSQFTSSFEVLLHLLECQNSVENSGKFGEDWLISFSKNSASIRFFRSME